MKKCVLFDNRSDGYITFEINFKNGNWYFSLNEEDLHSGIELATVTVKACTRMYMGNTWSQLDFCKCPSILNIRF